MRKRRERIKRQKGDGIEMIKEEEKKENKYKRERLREEKKIEESGVK